MTARPQVTALEHGAVLETKRMEAAEGIQWPRHKASAESVLVVTAGQLSVAMAETNHIMPKDIRYTFSG